MIKANELRIGDWVLINGAPIKVESVLSDEINLEWRGIFDDDIDVQGTDLETVNPIPLTPEILERCGFVQKKDDFGDDALILELRNSVDSYRLVFYANSDSKAVSVFHKNALIGTLSYHLHQLQNLFFALTGEELKIEL
jgi:hypothetical protein